MADETSQSIVIAAPASKIMGVIADFPAYPIWAGSVKSAEVSLPGDNGGPARRVVMKIENGPVRDEYELEYVWDGDRQVSWNLVRGHMQKAQHGSYTLTPVADGTEVVYHLSVDLHIPMLGLIKRKAERVIMDTALRELKRRVEGLG